MVPAEPGQGPSGLQDLKENQLRGVTSAGRITHKGGREQDHSGCERACLWPAGRVTVGTVRGHCCHPSPQTTAEPCLKAAFSYDPCFFTLDESSEPTRSHFHVLPAFFILCFDPLRSWRCLHVFPLDLELCTISHGHGL